MTSRYYLSLGRMVARPAIQGWSIGPNPASRSGMDFEESRIHHHQFISSLKETMYLHITVNNRITSRG